MSMCGEFRTIVVVVRRALAKPQYRYVAGIEPLDQSRVASLGHKRFSEADVDALNAVL